LFHHHLWEKYVKEYTGALTREACAKIDNMYVYFYIPPRSAAHGRRSGQTAYLAGEASTISLNISPWISLMDQSGKIYLRYVTKKALT
jgi:hypothetical protein